MAKPLAAPPGFKVPPDRFVVAVQDKSGDSVVTSRSMAEDQGTGRHRLSDPVQRRVDSHKPASRPR